MEDTRGLEDQISIYEIKLARMREQRQTIIAALWFFTGVIPLTIFLINLKYAFIGFISAPVCLVIGIISLRTHKHKYKRLLDTYNGLAALMLTEDKGGKE